MMPSADEQRLSNGKLTRDGAVVLGETEATALSGALKAQKSKWHR